MNAIILSWNLRGMGRPEKVRALINLLGEVRCNVCFIHETKLGAMKPCLANRLQGRRFGGLAWSPAEGASGGLVSLWDESFFVAETTVVNRRFIAVTGTLVSVSKQCCFINLYAPNEPGDRRIIFEEISVLISNAQCPVVVGGDFNVVLDESERQGSAEWVDRGAMLKDFIYQNALVDLPLLGDRFTWFRGGASKAASRIDRILMSQDFVYWFPMVTQRALRKSLSDHKAIVVGEAIAKGSSGSFKLFSHWLDVSEVIHLIENVVSTVRGKKLSLILKKVREAIKEWVSNFRASKQNKISVLKDKITALEEQVRGSGYNAELGSALKTLKNDLWAAYRREEREWHQKSREKWFVDGDRNTRYFHLLASLRRNRNLIHKVEW
ncbi:hypothetical protein HRI_002226800 [Hibiscus trionum]|uniref:Endonuclease/exonuclease/phosphatase domain-containing protein n=1 Tax=Hibiscus trionum TaxID=183268 RepID=A0A9W7HWB5_HIBTR|nr:hypothetical protein HRI_002226800 [Hibiscus trionum]